MTLKKYVAVIDVKETILSQENGALRGSFVNGKLRLISRN